jgi:hypothetical protein
MKHEIVLSIYMTVEADTEDEAFDKAEATTEELFEKAVQRLDETDGFEVGNWFCDVDN